jgi:DNA-directed RNA polymerase specialized sigma subunit
VIDAADALERRIEDVTDEVDRRIIALALEGRTQTEIATEIGFSQSKVSRRIKNFAGRA